MLYGISGGSDVARVGGRAGTVLVKSPNGGINETVHTRHHPGFAERARPRRGFRGVLLPSDNVVHAVDPEFDTDPAPGTRSVFENTPPGVNIGDPISATDMDEDDLEFGNTLTYSLGGDDAALFDIDPSTGQLITKAPLDHEDVDSHSVTVTVDDGEDRQTPRTQNVMITVTNVDEPPASA